MKHLLLILLVLLLSSFTKPLVEIGDNTCRKNKDTFSLKGALHKIQSNTIKDSIYLACLHHQIGVSYYLEYDYVLALRHFKEALKIREETDDKLLWKSHKNMASTYHVLNDYTRAIKHNQIAYAKPELKKTKDSINILRFLSKDFAAIGDIEQALQFSNIALKVNLKNLQKAEVLNSLGKILIDTNDSAKAILAIQHFNDALKLKDKENYDDKIWGFIYANKGIACAVLNQHEKALKNYNLAVHMFPEEDTLSKASVINNLGVIFMDQNKYQDAFEKFEQSLKLKKTYFNEYPYHFRYTFNYENIAECHFEMKNYEKALQNYQTAIINLTNSFRSNDVFQNPPFTNDLYVYSFVDLIRVLDLKAKTAFSFYQQNKNTAYLKLAHQTYQTLLDFHNQLQKDISTENSRLFQAKNILPYVENALEVVYALQDKEVSIAESAFRLMEKNKATVLLQSINESQALQFANIPDTLLFQEGELKTAINFYKKQLNDAKVYEVTDEITRIEKLLFEVENKYNRLIRNLESNYPDYYQLKYQQNEIQLKDALNYLDDDVAMLEYFAGDSSIYVLSIQKEKSKLYKTNKPKNWNELINTFRQSVTDIGLIQNEGSKAYNLFTNSAFELYTILFKQVLEDLEPNITHLKIVPDAELNYIPFDILLTEPANPEQINYADLAYLVKKNTLSYAYSAALLLESIQPRQLENDSLEIYVGFAPVYKPDTDNTTLSKALTRNNNIVLRSGKLVDLPDARASVQNIADFINGQAFLAKEATKQKFIDNANKFKIVHLATHGFLNDENPTYSNLAFSHTIDSTDHLLYAADLYNIELNTDLVVLSACNTGTGKLQNGEGVMSLSRAFTYAGSSSLIMSLWEVPDKSTSTIMQNFFKQLKKGCTKDQALQTAKLDFIKNRPDRAHPLYWAGFVPSGNMVAIDLGKERYHWWFWTMLITAVFIIGGVAITRN